MIQIDFFIRNPSCAVFPTITSCNIPNVGAAGGRQFHNGLCVLTQNIINEKIFLVLWFWYAFLGPLSVIYVFYRLITILFDGVRFALIYKKVMKLGLFVWYSVQNMIRGLSFEPN